MSNKYARAEELFGECLALYRALNDQAEVAQMLKNLGLIAKDQGDFARATAFYQESLTIRRELGDKRGVAQSFFNLGVVAYWQGDYAGAIDAERAGAGVLSRAGRQDGRGVYARHAGDGMCKQGAYAQAMQLLEESLVMFRELGDQFGIALLLTDMGGVAQARDDVGPGGAAVWRSAGALVEDRRQAPGRLLPGRAGDSGGKRPAPTRRSAVRRGGGAARCDWRAAAAFRAGRLRA